MLKFTLDEFFWVADAVLPNWVGFQDRRGPYASISSEQPSDGTVRLVFAPEGRDTSPLTETELTSIQWLLDNEGHVAAALLQNLIEAYPRLHEQFGLQENARLHYMPDVHTVEDLKPLIGLYAINIHQITKDAMPYAGYEFGCNWEEEHGLGVLMHGTRVVEMGHADIAFTFWIAERDAQSTPQ